MLKGSLFATLSVVTLILGAGVAHAGSGNLLYLEQESDALAADGNNFLSDQYLATNSSIGTPWNPATQKGNGNEADLTLSGNCPIVSPDCGHASLWQNNTDTSLVGYVAGWLGLTPLDPNTATIQVTGTGTATLFQSGGGNSANLTLEDGSGSIVQGGIDNSAALTLVGSAGGSIRQVGTGHSADLTVQGTGSATLNQLNILRSESFGPTVVTTNSDVTIARF